MSASTESSTRQPPQFARLKDLTGGGQAGLPEIFSNMAALLADAGIDLGMEFHICVDQAFQVFSLHVAGGTSQAETGPRPDADLVLITSQETWQEIASGSLSPFDALGAGRLRLRGDTHLAVRALKHLAGTPGRTEIC
jgi:putative sterol carrier protein